MADVIRPKEAASGLKVPVIFHASPYYAPSQSAIAGRDPRYRPLGEGQKDPDDEVSRAGSRAGTTTCSSRAAIPS